MKEAFENWLLVFSIIIVSGVILYFALPRKNIAEDGQVQGVASENYQYAPYVSSIAPLSVEVNEFFEYEVQVSDLDTPREEIFIYLSERPEWMDINGNSISGIPSKVGTYKFVVTVSDGFNSTSQINYVLVEGNE